MPNNLKRHQKEAVGRMLVQGTPTKAIAAAVGITTQTLNRILKQGDTEIERYRDKFAGMIVQYEAIMRFNLIERVDQYIENIDKGLVSKDERVRLETTWKCMAEVDKNSPSKEGTEIDSKTQEILVAGQKATGELMTELRDIFREGRARVEDRVKTGEDALPGPLPQISDGADDEPIDVEFEDTS